jgi:FAD/FMN-containing dehydrogenase
VPDVATATHLCQQLAARFDRPGTALELFEIIADSTLRRALDHAELSLRDGTRKAPYYAMALVVSEVATGPSVFGSAFVEELVTVLMSEFTGRDGAPLYPNGDIDIDHDPARLLHVRESCSEMSRLLPKQSYDIVVPVARLDAFVTALTTAMGVQHAAIQLSLFGHAGVGALHLHAVAEDQDTVDRAREDLDRLVFDLVQEHGGSPWAEHGVGRKWGAEWQRRTPQAVQQEMLAIKRRHDPDNVIGSRLFGFDRLLAG